MHEKDGLTFRSWNWVCGVDSWKNNPSLPLSMLSSYLSIFLLEQTERGSSLYKAKQQIEYFICMLFQQYCENSAFAKDISLISILRLQKMCLVLRLFSQCCHHKGKTVIYRIWDIFSQFKQLINMQEETDPTFDHLQKVSITLLESSGGSCYVIS